MSIRSCACGCGRAPKPDRRFIHGHSGPAALPIETGWLVEDRGHTTPCWTWQRCRSRDGYAHAKVDGRTRPVHITNWCEQNGPVPEGLELDHLCRNRACVNPDHLEAVAHAENIRRGRATKLRPADVLLVRLLAATTSLTRRDIAETVGVKSHGTVNFILAGARQ